MDKNSNTQPEPSRPFDPQWFFLPAQALKNVEKGFYSRWGHSIDIIGESLYMYGGTALKRSQQKTWESINRINLLTWQCEQLENKTQAPIPKALHSMFRYKEKFYIFGGNSSTETPLYQNNLSEYDLTTQEWRTMEVQGTGPSPREGHCCCVVKGRYVVIFGGWNGSESFDDHFVLDLEGMRWLKIQKVEGKKPSTRESQSCCVYEDVVYVFGGQGKGNTEADKGSDIYLDELYRLKVRITEDDQVILDWEEIVNDVRPPKRASHAACIYDGKMFVIGGEGYQKDLEDGKQQTMQKSEEEDDYVCYPKNDVWYYDIAGSQWHQVHVPNRSQFTSRLGHRIIPYGGFILVVGGLRDYNRPASEVSILSMYGDDPFEVVKAQVKEDEGDFIDVEKIEIPVASDKIELLKNPPKEENKMEIEAPVTEKNDAVQQVPKPLVHINRPSTTMVKAAMERTATKLENTVVSMGFIGSIASLITSPLAAFGLLVDNAIINKAANMQIIFSKFSPMNAANYEPVKSQAKGKKKKDAKEEEADESSNPSNLNLLTPYVVIEDNGKGWKLKEFLRILLNYDLDTPQSFDLPDMSEADAFEEDERVQKINEYALNLKAGCFRLGRTFVFATKYEDEISLGMLSTEKQYGAGPQSGQVFYASWKKSTGEFQTEYGYKYKKIILKAISGFASEEDLMKSLDKFSTRIFVVDMNAMSVAALVGNNSENTELVQKRKGQEPATDVRVRAFGKELKRMYTKLPTILVDVSLRTYLSYLFLDGGKTGLEIKLNEAVIVNAGLKELVNMKGKENSVKVEQEGLFNAVIVGTGKRGKKGVKDTVFTEKDNNQGILMYYNNRLIRRFENPKLGNLDFTMLRYQGEEIDHNLGIAGSRETYGYVELDSPFKPNVVKTEIENFYYSNFLYAELLTKVMEVDSVLGKRNAMQRDEEDSEYDVVTKKLSMGHEKRKAMRREEEEAMRREEEEAMRREEEDRERERERERAYNEAMEELSKRYYGDM